MGETDRGAMGHRSVSLPLLLLTALAVGCATPLELSPPADAPRSVRVWGVPFIPQRDAQCGPAALAMALQHAGADRSVEELSPLVFTRGRGGSFPLDLVGATRRSGHVPYRLNGWAEITRQLAAGYPVVVLQNLGLDWLPRWHFAVLIGYDVDRSAVLLHTGTYRALKRPMTTFARTWVRADRWAHVMLPPGQLPVGLPEDRVLTEIAKLERAGQPGAALGAYLAARSRWPQSARPALGAGNAWLALGDAASAEAALRVALELDPASIPALNNLAHALAQLGREGEAIELLEGRLDASGSWRPVLERTLEEMRTRRRLPRSDPPATGTR